MKNALMMMVGGGTLAAFAGLGLQVAIGTTQPRPAPAPAVMWGHFEEVFTYGPAPDVIAAERSPYASYYLTADLKGPRL